MAQRRAAVERASANLFTTGPVSKHQMLRALWRLAAAQVGHATAPIDSLVASLPPRGRQTLDQLLLGRSEKEIAANLELSQNTVHDYVRVVYRRFAVTTRAELLSRFLVERSDLTLFRSVMESAAGEGPATGKPPGTPVRSRRPPRLD